MSGSLANVGPYEEPTSFENVIVPEGMYAVRFDKMVNKISSAGVEYEVMVFVILDNTYPGATAADRWYLYGGTDGAVKRTKIMVNQARKALDMKDAKEASEFLSGVLAAEIVTDTYKDKSKNIIKAFHDIKDYPELADKIKTFNDDVPF